jgi:hypothetical protein
MDASFQVVAVPSGATSATLAEALCCSGADAQVAGLYLRGEKALPHP